VYIFIGDAQYYANLLYFCIIDNYYITYKIYMFIGKIKCLKYITYLTLQLKIKMYYIVVCQLYRLINMDNKNPSTILFFGNFKCI